MSLSAIQEGATEIWPGPDGREPVTGDGPAPAFSHEFRGYSSVTTRTVLMILIVLAPVLCGCWDVYVHIRGKDEETVSSGLLKWGREAPVLLLGIGFVLGHLFWPQLVRNGD
jgi:hypothetical protein